ncbi:exonuclease domain-containing protein [Klebsiella pneumoniae]|uniref:exonuclease domain-containing protein n=1 Tax=Klebsiella pneumoniae TaxID=573 RepID=UPI0035BA3E5C
MTVATGIDIETTGLDVYSGHKIIEIALVSYDIETANKLREVSLRFNPRRNIDAKAQAVHGISLEMFRLAP